MHRKHHLLLQIGGHIELDETPWQAMAHELAEECGYTFDELAILQPDDALLEITHAIVHPVPVLMNTHVIADSHYHSDLSFAFIAAAAPRQSLSEGESVDLRWLTMQELADAATQGIAANDVVNIYQHILTRYLPKYYSIPASRYSLDKPHSSSM
jgi:8-oxo-dGTP pyrophosphatase MutT (NUDIX family)